jgi:flavorubredoxin
MVRELTEDVYWINPCIEHKDRHVHNSAYLIHNEGGNILVDTGSFLDHEQAKADIRSVVGDEGVEVIMLTHPDLPHTGNVWEYMDDLGASEVMSAAAVSDAQGLLPWGEGLRKIVIGKQMEVCGRRISATEALLADRFNSAWLYDHETGVYFTADGFGHYHFDDEHDRTSDEIEDGISSENVREYHQDKLPWLRFVEPASFTEALGDLLDQFDPTWIAPVHGNPIHADDQEEYVQQFRSSVQTIVDEHREPGSPNPALER